MSFGVEGRERTVETSLVLFSGGTVGGVLFMENDERDVGLSERSQETFEICTWVHGVGAVGCEVLGVNDNGK